MYFQEKISIWNLFLFYYTNSMKKTLSALLLTVMLVNNSLFVSASEQTEPVIIEQPIDVVVEHEVEIELEEEENQTNVEETQQKETVPTDITVLDPKDVDQNNLNPQIQDIENVVIEWEKWIIEIIEKNHCVSVDDDESCLEQSKEDEKIEKDTSVKDEGHCIQIDGEECLPEHNTSTFVVKFITNKDFQFVDVTVNEKELLVLPKISKEMIWEDELFNWWYLDESFTNKFDETKTLTSNIKLYAKFEKKEVVQQEQNKDEEKNEKITTPSYSWGWGSYYSVSTTKSEENKVVEQQIIEEEKKDIECNFNFEDVTNDNAKAAFWACQNNIEKDVNLTKENLDKPMTRKELAKVISSYLMNIAKKDVILKTNIPTYLDVEDDEYKEYITIAYQYQVMWIDWNWKALEKFMPNAIVTRAEFATVLSRVLFGSEFNVKDWKTPFYQEHIKALAEANILSEVNHKITELKKFVLIMLQRSSVFFQK